MARRQARRHVRRNAACSRTGRRPGRRWPGGRPAPGTATRRSPSARRPAVHAGRARRHRVRDRVRRGDRQEAVGGRARPALRQRPRRRAAGTPTVDGDRLYAFGASGDLTALDAATGKVFWTVNVLEKFGGSNINWGLSESPLVLSDRILVTPGGRGASIVALQEDRRLADLEEPERRAGLFIGRAARGRRRSRRRFTSRPSARSASTSHDGQAAVELRPGRQRHRQHRDADRRGATASSCRPTTAPAPRCSS